MNTKTVGILAVAAVAAGTAAFITLRGRESSVAGAQERTKLFPTLSKSINDAESITIERKDGSFTLQKQAGGWGLADKAGYPVDLEPVRKTLITLADMKTLEPKTANASQYARLGVEDVAAADSKSAQITVKDGAGTELAKLVVGKNYESKNYSPQSYVRKAGDAQSWLVEGQLDLKEHGTDWLKKEILKVARDRIRKVEVRHADGEIVHVERATPEQADFTLDAIPEGKELTYATVAGTLASGLDYLNLEDVQPAGGIDFTQTPGPTTTYWCFDGLKVTVECKEQDAKTYARFSAAYDDTAPAGPVAEPAPDAEKKDEPAKPAKKSPDEVKKEVEELNARLSKWTYVISSYNRGIFFKRMSDLVKDKAPPPPPPGSEPAGGAGSADTMKIPSDLPPEIQEAIKKDLESRGEKSEVVPVPAKPAEGGATPPGEGAAPAPAGGTTPPPSAPPH